MGEYECDEDEGANRSWHHLSIHDVKYFNGEHSHCAFCFNSSCDEIDICPIIQCQNCKVKLHECKAEDHHLICPKAFSPCINSQYGCPELIRNELRGFHLAKCAASSVACNLQWNREIIGKMAKRRMKKVARGFKKQMLDVELRENEVDELDVFAALDDQLEILESYRTFRQSRVRQRTACTPANPVLPLRFYDKMTTYPEEDSSDEEQFKEEQERKKKKQPFADCYICKLEPGLQHLHILGNMNAKKDTGNQETVAPDLDKTLSLVVPKFYQKRNLFVKLSEARMPDHHRKAFQYSWTREMHTFTCQHIMRRDEVASHWLYHTDLLQLIDGEIIKRCPAALNGCDFYVRRMIPKDGGRVRYDAVTRLFVYVPCPEISPAISANNNELGSFTNAHVLRLLLPYLDSRSVRDLSAVNSTFCFLVRGLIRSRTLLSIKWVRVGKLKWVAEANERHFSNIPSVPALIPNVKANSDMSKHIAECPYCERATPDESALLVKALGDVFMAHIKSKKSQT